MEVDSELLEIREIFVSEASELLDQLEKQFLVLDESPTSVEALNEVFRIAHSIKGSAAAVALDQISSFAHTFESFLSFIRLRPDVNTKSRVGLMLEANDLLRLFFSNVMSQQDVDTQTVESLTSKLKAESLLVEEEIKNATAEVQPKASEEGENTDKKSAAGNSQLLKVSVERVNSIQQVVGELATLRTQLLSNIYEPRQLQLVVGLMDKNIRELNDRVLDMKKSSLDPLKQRISRVVRDVSQKLGKKIDFDFESNQEFVEKTILDALVDPMVHMVRNSIDHGLETPEERFESGKPEAGSLKIRITVEPTLVDVEITDDGKGINPNVILKKAREKNLVGDEVQGYSTKQILGLLFLPGFSTAETVSEFSGRGVGLDVVRSNIEALGGSVSIDSTVGLGTNFNIQIPLKNGLSEALSVQHRNKSYLVSINGIVKIVNIDRARIQTPTPEIILYQCGGKSLQIVPLDTTLDDLEIPAKSSGVVVECNGHHYLIPIQHVGSKAQYMIKPLGKWLNQSPGMLGMSVIGDGTPVPFLDLKKLILDKLKSTTNLDRIA